MSRKTYRPDDVCFLLRPEDVAAGIETVGAWLDEKHMARSVMKKMFQEKLVLLNGKKTNPKETVALNDELRLQMPKEKLDYDPVPMELVILYEDEELLILDKPVGITVNSRGQVSLANGVAQYFLDNGIKRKVRFLNRLDRDTSGCIVIAKSALAQSFYQQQIEDQRFEKWYSTVVQGVLTDTNIVELPMARGDDGIHYEVREDGKPTRTVYNGTGVFEEVEGDEIGDVKSTSYREVSADELATMSEAEQAELVSTVDIRLYTGKTHQIRVAMAHLGHPLVGDALYSNERSGRTYELRARRVVFTSLRTGEIVTVSAD
ncbi:RluA family pseudouridine synthase [uncultured Veillonella sp.]|uniref:RluA family pseudouridine synthase n=1 Tax=uncultured Veillonella sp. TaxID=159268 RepID=UPI0027DCD67B|nr:RluA family pseudouridine synthase [uncultured Veillonella sp.]